MGKRVAIFGARGFIGKYLVDQLVKEDEIGTIVEFSSPKKRMVLCYPSCDRIPDLMWTSRNCDIRNYTEVEGLLKEADPDIVYHFAAIPNTKEGTNPTELTMVNALGTHNILTAIEKLDKKVKFVFASSATVYGNYGGVATEQTDTFPNSVYGATKLYSENLINIFTDKGVVDPLICRLIANVGLNATHGVLPDVFKKLHTGSPELELFGDSPGSIKPYMYVRDTARIITKLSLMDVKGVVNIVPDDSISILALANCVMEATGIYKPIKWLGKNSIWFGDNPKVLVSNNKMKNLLEHMCCPINFLKSEQAVKQVALEMMNA